MKNFENIIIGGGISGIVLHNNFKNSLLIEKNKHIGGLCYTYEIDDFKFDITGHYLHLLNNIKHTIEEQINFEMYKIKKYTKIYTNNKFIDFPFQTNFHSLNKKIINECIKGFINRDKNIKPNNFYNWILKYYGQGIGKYFMFPYNEKLWTYNLKRMNTDWIGEFIPNINEKDILYGNKNKKSYNSYFYYPKKGGFKNIIKVKNKRNIHLNEELIKIDIKKRIIYTNKDKYKYENLFSTIPLKELIKIIYKKESKLKFSSVYNINLGVKGSINNKSHWIYIPEKKFTFYRIGIPSNVNKNNAPNGYYSLSIEIGYRNKIKYDYNDLLNMLKQIGLVKNKKDIVVKQENNIKYGYVFYDKNREQIVNNYIDILLEYDIFTTGRYGKWHYSFVAKDIMDALLLSEIVSKR